MPGPRHRNGPATQYHPVLIRFGRLGDMVMLEPLLELLHRRYGQRCWLIGSGPWARALYAPHADVARVWTLAGRHTPFLLGPTWWRALWALRHSGGAPVYVCEDTAAQGRRILRLLALAGVAPERGVFHAGGTVEASEHCVDRLLRFGLQTPAALAGYPAPATRPRAAPQLEVTDADREAFAAQLPMHGAANRPIVLVQPGNRKTMRPRRWRRPGRIDDKAWPLERWTALLQCVRDSLPEPLLVLCGTRRELALLRRIRAAGDPGAFMVMRSTPSRLLGACAAAHSMISVDTGPAHLGAAVGTPLVVLFGRASPRHWCPRSAHGSAVIALGGPPCQ